MSGWVSADQRPLSRVMCSRLDPDWPVHAILLSIQQILGLPRLLTPSTRRAFGILIFFIAYYSRPGPQKAYKGEPLKIAEAGYLTFRMPFLSCSQKFQNNEGLMNETDTYLGLADKSNGGCTDAHNQDNRHEYYKLQHIHITKLPITFCRGLFSAVYELFFCIF